MTGSSSRVVHIVPALFSDDDGVVGGAERYVLELARHMADVVPTSLVTFGRREREETVGALRIRVVGDPWYVRGQKANPFAMALLHEVARADVVHCHQQHIVASSAAAVTGRVLGRPVFCTDLGGGGFDLSTFVSTDRLFTAHLHISEYSRRVFGHDGKPWARVIRGGVDLSRFSPPAGSLARNGLLFVGRILPHKGVDALIRALPDGVTLRVVGPAPHRRYLDDLRRLASNKAVTFHHDADDAALVRFYQQTSCIALPSVYDDMYGNHTDVPELLGQTLLEGMACGAAGLCTNVASLPEIVRNGVTGLIVPAGDLPAMSEAIAQLIADGERTRQMGIAGSRDVRYRFAWSAVVERCLQMYGLKRSLECAA
jgi:glycosyltransferase involved in cell wall biosynthesis